MRGESPPHRGNTDPMRPLAVHLSRLLPAVLALALVAASGQGQAADPLPRGQVIEKLPFTADPSKSYALYLPSAYDPARRWPVVYLLDARGVALVPLERFRAGAEKYGYVLASSYDSASDGPRDPNLAALDAMWSDTRARLALDDRRVYVAGFSGTARSACAIATQVPGKIAGIIGAGAGWPPTLPPSRNTPFVFFGAAGDRDFNYDELQELDEQLDRVEVPHRIEYFAGEHSWMPEPVATLALEWMEVRAMRAGVRERDPALLAALLRQELAAARELEAAGRPLDAWRRFRGAAGDFSDLAEPAAVAEARREAGRLAGSRAVEEERRVREQRRARDRRLRREAYHVLAVLEDRMEPGDPGETRRLVRSLGIAGLRAREKRHGDAPEGLSAARELAALYGQTAFYLPRDAVARRDYRKAALYLSIAAEIKPENPRLWGRLAATRALARDREGALAALRRAVELGYPDLAELAADEDFASLREDPAFRVLVDKSAAAEGHP